MRVRSMLREYAARIRADGEATLDTNGGGGGGGVLTVRAADQMDDGSPIELQLTIDEARGLYRFDFGGTGAQVHGDWNAPSAVTTAAVIYCLRLLVGREILSTRAASSPSRSTSPPARCCRRRPTQRCALGTC